MTLWDTIKTSVNEKIEENREIKNIKKQARKEALEELKPILKEKYKEEELAKLTKPKQNPLMQLGSEMSALASDSKLDRMLGKDSKTKEDSKLDKMLGNKQKDKKAIKDKDESIIASNEQMSKLLGKKV